jgi:hypothetical protein
MLRLTNTTDRLEDHLATTCTVFVLFEPCQPGICHLIRAFRDSGVRHAQLHPRGSRIVVSSLTDILHHYRLRFVIDPANVAFTCCRA